MKRLHWLWLLVFLAGIFFLELASIRGKSFTADEEDHYGYGWNILMLNSDSRIVGNGTLMPVNSLNALPRLVGRQLPEGRIKNFLVALETGRLVTMLFSLLLAFSVFKWSRELYGIAAGFFSLFLFAFSPTLIAHSRLITNDIFSACMMTLSLYYFWRFLSSGGWKLATLVAVLAGLSQIVKYTMLAVYPIFIVILLCYRGQEIAAIIRAKKWETLARRFLVFVGYGLFFGLVGLLMINVGFLFHGTFTPLDEYNFKSLSWQNIQSRSGPLGAIPLPLPTLYLEGPDDRKWEEETGEHANNYLFGELRNPGYFPGYFFWAFLYRVPFALQLTIILSGIAYLKNRRTYTFRENEIFLWVPILLFTIYLNYFLFIQSGFRFIIPIFPLFLVMGGNLLRNWRSFSLSSRISLGLLATYLIVSVLSYFPHYLSYFNELVWDRKMAYKILADSNIEWGQNRNYLGRYLSEHPEVIFSPKHPRAGKIVLRANDLVGLFRPEEYRWLRENFEPVDHIAYTYLVYDVTPESLQDALRRRNRQPDDDKTVWDNLGAPQSGSK